MYTSGGGPDGSALVPALKRRVCVLVGSTWDGSQNPFTCHALFAKLYARLHRTAKAMLSASDSVAKRSERNQTILFLKNLG